MGKQVPDRAGARELSPPRHRASRAWCATFPQVSPRNERTPPLTTLEGVVGVRKTHAKNALFETETETVSETIYDEFPEPSSA